MYVVINAFLPSNLGGVGLGPHPGPPGPPLPERLRPAEGPPEVLPEGPEAEGRWHLSLLGPPP